MTKIYMKSKHKHTYKQATLTHGLTICARIPAKKDLKHFKMHLVNKTEARTT